MRADHVVALRGLLSRVLPEVHGLTDNEKDPEELLNGLLGTLLKPKTYLQMKYTG